MGAVAMLVVAGRILARGVDARYLMVAGLLTLAVGNYWMSLMNLDIQSVAGSLATGGGDRRPVDGIRPLNVAAFLYIPTELRGAAVGLLALLRNEGGSVGTSVAQTILERRDQFHALRLGEPLDALNPEVKPFLEQSQALFLQSTGDGPLSRLMALQSLERLRQPQTLALAYFDVFWGLAVVALLLVFLLMRRSVVDKGTHVWSAPRLDCAPWGRSGWIEDYNTRAPHSALGMRSPADYRAGSDSKLLPVSRTLGSTPRRSQCAATAAVPVGRQFCQPIGSVSKDVARREALARVRLGRSDAMFPKALTPSVYQRTKGPGATLRERLRAALAGLRARRPTSHKQHVVNKRFH